MIDYSNPIRITIEHNGVSETIIIPVGDYRKDLIENKPYHTLTAEDELPFILQQHITAWLNVGDIFGVRDEKRPLVLRDALKKLIRNIRVKLTNGV